MRTYGEALDVATDKYILTGKNQYIIYNHVKCRYRVSKNIRYGVNEELANMVNSIN